MLGLSLRLRASFLQISGTYGTSHQTCSISDATTKTPKQNKPLVSSFSFFLYSHRSSSALHKSRPRGHDALGRRGSSSPRVPPEADARVFPRCARTQRLSSPRVHRSSVDGLAPDPTTAPDSSFPPRGVVQIHPPETRVGVRSSQPLTLPPRPNYPSTHTDAPRCRRCPVT